MRIATKPAPVESKKTETEIETKLASIAIETLSEADGSFSGLAIPFDTLHDTSSWMLGDGWQDKVVKGSFTDTLAEHKANGTMPLLQWMHQRGNIIGAITSAKETPEGVRVEGKVSPNAISPSGVPVLELLRTKAVSGLSIGFRPTRVSLDEDTKVRTIQGIEWNELSVVDIAGAGPDARVTDIKSGRRELEAWLRSSGLSAGEVKGLIAKGIVEFLERHNFRTPEALNLTNVARKGLDSSAQADQKTAAAHAAHGGAMAAHAEAMAAHVVAANDRTMAAQQCMAKGDTEACAAHDAAAERHNQMASMHRDMTGFIASAGPASYAARSAGESKAQWTGAYIDDLPDSAFLHVDSGGKKDANGKTTPRSLRHLPFKDADGKVDLPHLRNAAARIPQSNLSADVKKQLATKVAKMLEDAADGGKDDATEGPDGQKKFAPIQDESADPVARLINVLKDPREAGKDHREGGQDAAAFRELAHKIHNLLE